MAVTVALSALAVLLLPRTVIPSNSASGFNFLHICDFGAGSNSNDAAWLGRPYSPVYSAATGRSYFTAAEGGKSNGGVGSSELYCSCQRNGLLRLPLLLHCSLCHRCLHVYALFMSSCLNVSNILLFC